MGDGPAGAADARAEEREMPGLRVIAGTARGRKLAFVPGEETRPIGDRVKGALFNILGADIEGAAMLDLFAGTGGVGIEALSRGARRVLFVDASARAVRTIRHNLEHTGLAAGASVLQRDAFGLLEGPVTERFDYVYVAPPQRRGLWAKALETLERLPGWLNPDAWVIAQIHPREYLALELKALEEFDRRTYGNTALVFYRLPGS